MDGSGSSRTINTDPDGLKLTDPEPAVILICKLTNEMHYEHSITFQSIVLVIKTVLLLL
jgi:hypothetical protein